MKVAVVHEWLVLPAGSEQVVGQILRCYPDADLFSVVDFLPDDRRDLILNKRATTSFVQKLPFAERKYQHYLALMPLAVEQFDLSSYDLVISSNHAVAKGVITSPDQLHVSYVHTPMRYAWDLQHQYLSGAGLTRGLKSWAARSILHYMRLWDAQTANRVDAFAANSAYIKRRIAKVYRRDACVIYPPVDVAEFQLQEQKENFYLAASRMVQYKLMPLIVEAFAAMPDKRLVVIGDGPDLARCKAVAGPNIEFLGYQSFDVLKDHMQRAKAFVFAAEEDFGITPVEAQACGTPVIAYGRGGVTETVRGLESDKPTGLFFAEQTVPAIVEAVAAFERAIDRFDPVVCRENSLQFSPDRFRAEFAAFVDRVRATGLKAAGSN